MHGETLKVLELFTVVS